MLESISDDKRYRRHHNKPRAASQDGGFLPTLSKTAVACTCILVDYTMKHTEKARQQKSHTTWEGVRARNLGKPYAEPKCNSIHEQPREHRYSMRFTYFSARRWPRFLIPIFLASSRKWALLGVIIFVYDFVFVRLYCCTFTCVEGFYPKRAFVWPTSRAVIIGEFSFGNLWKFVSRYGGVLSRFVKLNRSKNIRRVQFHIVWKKEPRKIWKIFFVGGEKPGTPGSLITMSTIVQNPVTSPWSLIDGRRNCK